MMTESKEYWLKEHDTDWWTEQLIVQYSVSVFTGHNKWMNRLTPWSRVPLEKLIIPYIVKKHRHFVERWLSYTPSPCFMPSCFRPFCCNALCQFTLHCSLCFFIFGLTPFGWLCSSMLTPLFLMGIQFLMRTFLTYAHLFRNRTVT